MTTRGFPGSAGSTRSTDEQPRNVFADLDLPNSEQELLKADLTLPISKVLRSRRLTQAQAGKLLGIPQPHVPDLLNGRARGAP